MGKYNDFLELKNSEKEGKDYRIRWWNGKSGIAIVAPHGGEIEPGTSEVARALAGSEHTFYCFEGLKPEANTDLHITSTNFDEPVALNIAKNSLAVVSIHGCKGREKFVILGGRDAGIKVNLCLNLQSRGYVTVEEPRLPGLSLKNICNKGQKGMGLQLEISVGLRRTFFEGLTRSARKGTTRFFDEFVSTIRKSLLDYYS